MVMIDVNYFGFSTTAFTGITKIWCSFSELSSYSWSMLNATTAFMVQSIRIGSVFCKIIWTIKRLFAGYTPFSVPLTSCLRLGLLLQWGFAGYSTVQQIQLIVPGMFVKVRRVLVSTRIGFRHVQMLAANSIAHVCCCGWSGASV